jgi:S1-C subfamily serine protease
MLLALLTLLSACDFEPKMTGGPVAIIEGTPPNHGLLGASIIDNAQGSVEVADIVPGGPAEKAGITVGDWITRLDSSQVSNASSLLEVLKPRNPGETVEVGFTRDGEDHTASVTLASITEMIRLHAEQHSASPNENKSENEL